MPKRQLDNLVAGGHLKAEPPAATEIEGLIDAHRRRNVIEYEGVADVDQALVAGVVRVTNEMAKRLRALGPLKPS